MTVVEERRHQMPRRVELLMLVLAFLMLPLVVIEESSGDPNVEAWGERAATAIWLAFVVEFGYYLVRAKRRGRFIREHWFDLAIIVLTPPVAWLPNEWDALRALRALRLVRAFAVVGRTQHTLRRYLRRGSLPYLMVLSLFVVLLGGLSIHALEPDRASSVGDGVWWAAATLSTVGYGDIAPATLLGRFVAVVLMLVGVGTFAALTAAVAAYFVEEGSDTEHASQLAAIHRDVRELRSDLARISEMLDGRRGHDASRDSDRA